MRAEIKAYGRGKKADIRKHVGGLFLRADSAADATLLRWISELLYSEDRERKERFAKFLDAEFRK